MWLRNVFRKEWCAMIRTGIIITILFRRLSKVCVDQIRMRQCYYLAKMLYAGEDIKFIARRIMICAAEDVGNADPMALTVAVSAAQAVERIGMPEAQIILSQAVTVCSDVRQKVILRSMRFLRQMKRVTEL